MYQVSAFQYEVIARQRMAEAARAARHLHQHATDPAPPAAAAAAPAVRTFHRRRPHVSWHLPSFVRPA